MSFYDLCLAFGPNSFRNYADNRWLASVGVLNGTPVLYANNWTDYRLTFWAIIYIRFWRPCIYFGMTFV